MQDVGELTMDISQSIEVNAPVGDTYAAMIRRLTLENATPDNRAMPMVLEEWPGGRWFRDLGAGQGHLWGFVQVIKPPNLIEIHGPMFMSYAVAGHLQVRITQITGGCEVFLRHQAIGSILDEHRQGITLGWDHFLQTLKAMAEQS